MKKPLLLFIIILLLGCFNSPAQSVRENGSLSVKGTKMVNKKGETLVLRGVSYGWHNWWSRFYNQETVAHLAKDWNCSVVRAAMGVGPKGSYLDKKEWSREKIEAVINGAIENDIYVIIDWHSHKLYEKEAIEFFSEMAKKYGKHPNIIYEIFNEPVKNSWTEIKNYSLEVIKAIRELDPDNIILVGSPHWDQDIHVVADDPIKGFSNIMYTVHFYAATHGKELRKRGDYALKKGIPIFVSECAGMQANGDGPVDQKSWKEWLKWMENNEISWVCWSIADKNETCSMLRPSASNVGDWTNDDMKEWGLATKKTIKKYNSGL